MYRSGRSNLRDVLWIAACFIGLIAIAGCGGSSHPTTAFAASPSSPGSSSGSPSGPSPSPTPTATPAPQPTPDPTPAPTPTPSPAPALSGPFGDNIKAVAQWFAAKTIAPDGAILYGSSAIDPYYSNEGALGLVKDPASYPIVQRWMQWYINHLNWPDQWGLYGSIYNYTYDHGAEKSTNHADSTDSYAGTFLSLAWAYFSTGDPDAQSYVRTLSSQLDAIGQVIIATQEPDGLTWALPNWKMKYLMDNCESYRGLRDLAQLFQNAFNDFSKADYYNNKADLMLQGINGMWLNGNWAVAKGDIGQLFGPNYGKWYPDSTSQLFPAMQGVISADDPRSQSAYANFNKAWPGWPTLSYNRQDAFPWVMIAGAAAAMGDDSRVNTYLNTIQKRYATNGFPWPWYAMEGGWYMRLNAYLMGERPL